MPIPPLNDLNSAIVRNLAPGHRTTIVRGVTGTTGVALVEADRLHYSMGQAERPRATNPDGKLGTQPTRHFVAYFLLKIKNVARGAGNDQPDRE